MVNGTVYPVLHVAPEAYRFEILNAANDRYWNLSLYQAGDYSTTAGVTSFTPCASAPANPVPANTLANCTEVKFVPSNDGIAGQGPWVDPLTAGPSFVQFGTDGGSDPLSLQPA